MSVCSSYMQQGHAFALVVFQRHSRKCRRWLQRKLEHVIRNTVTPLSLASFSSSGKRGWRKWIRSSSWDKCCSWLPQSSAEDWVILGSSQEWLFGCTVWTRGRAIEMNDNIWKKQAEHFKIMQSFLQVFLYYRIPIIGEKLTLICTALFILWSVVLVKFGVPLSIVVIVMNCSHFFWLHKQNISWDFMSPDKPTSEGFLLKVVLKAAVVDIFILTMDQIDCLYMKVVLVTTVPQRMIPQLCSSSSTENFSDFQLVLVFHNFIVLVHSHHHHSRRKAIKKTVHCQTRQI